MTIHIQPKSVLATADTAPTPIDHVHLARYTMGNRALELEVLHLFVGQAPSTLQDLERASCDKSWHMAAHTMKGSARAVGAGRLARAAERAEAASPKHADRDAMIAEMRAAIDEAAVYIGGLAATSRGGSE